VPTSSNSLVAGQRCAGARLNTGLPLCRAAYGIQDPTPAGGESRRPREIRRACFPCVRARPTARLQPRRTRERRNA